MMTEDFSSLPIDAESAEQLRVQGLRLGLVDTGDPDAFERWLFAESRGFHAPRSTPEVMQQDLDGLTDQRTTAVWDDSAHEAETPVATVSCWPSELTVPGGNTVDVSAITAVTVSPAYRRRGIAKSLLEAELRTAIQLGFPMAVLTVTESTIYSRFGFAPAALCADISIDTQRARWVGPTASGRVQFVPPAELLTEGRALVERIRPQMSGEVQMRDHKWRRTLGLVGDKDAARSLRTVRYDDAAGVPQGFAIYRVHATDPNHAAQVLELEYFLAATDDAYSGLWAFLLRLDLIGTITAKLRPVDEPLPWQLADFRAVQKTDERDHLWVRILDPKVALERRRYSSPGRIVLDVSDPHGFADGRVLLEIDGNGEATVSPFEGEIPDDAAGLALTVNDLGALYLGGVSFVTLVRAGRVTELREGSALAADTSFRTSIAPWLSFWF